MTRNRSEKMRRPRGERPFPWRCPNCGQKEVHRSPHPYEAEVKHDGRSYRLAIPDLLAPKCRACDEVLFDENVDEQVNSVLRAEIGLLSPEDILRDMSQFGLNQRALAKRLGIAEETLSRWVNGVQIQSKAMDNSLRRFFEERRSTHPVDSIRFGQCTDEAVNNWRAMFPNVAHIAEVVEYSRTVAGRGQLLLLGAE